MFVYEKVDKNDKELYEKVSDRLYDEKWSQWGADRENDIYIVCTGKHGVETPVIFKMLYKSHLFEFILPEPDITYGPPKLWISIPNELQNDRIDIREQFLARIHLQHFCMFLFPCQAIIRPVAVRTRNIEQGVPVKCHIIQFVGSLHQCFPLPFPDFKTHQNTFAATIANLIDHCAVNIQHRGVTISLLKLFIVLLILILCILSISAVPKIFLPIR